MYVSMYACLYIFIYWLSIFLQLSFPFGCHRQWPQWHIFYITWYKSSLRIISNTKVSVAKYLRYKGKKPHLTSPCFAWMERVLPQQVRTVYYLATGCHWCLLYFSNTSKCMSNSSSHHRLVSYTLVWLADQLSK